MEFLEKDAMEQERAKCVNKCPVFARSARSVRKEVAKPQRRERNKSTGATQCLNKCSGGELHHQILSHSSTYKEESALTELEKPGPKQVAGTKSEVLFNLHLIYGSRNSTAHAQLVHSSVMSRHSVAWNLLKACMEHLRASCQIFEEIVGIRPQKGVIKHLLDWLGCQQDDLHGKLSINQIRYSLNGQRLSFHGQQ